LQGYLGHHLYAKEIDSTVKPLTTLERDLVQTFPPSSKGLSETNVGKEIYTLTSNGYDLADRTERKHLDDYLENEGNVE